MIIDDIDADIRAIRARRGERHDDPDYARLLRDKTIAIVGPARTALGAKLGHRIDGHDIVVRFNDAFDFVRPSPDPADDIGTRVDVLYTNQVILRDLLARRTLPIDAFNRAGLKCIVCTNNSLSFTAAGTPRHTCPPPDRRIVADLSAALTHTGSTAQVRVVSEASEILARWLRGNWARTGLVGIVDLLSFDVRRLFITGMTFYHGGGHMLMPASAELHPQRNRDGTWAQPPGGLGHDSYLELEVMKRLAQRFGDVLELDETLTALLRT